MSELPVSPLRPTDSDPGMDEALRRARAAAVVPAADEGLALKLLDEFRAAWSEGDHDRMSEVMLAAVDLDRANPDHPRLMDEIRGLRQPAVAA